MCGDSRQTSEPRRQGRPYSLLDNLADLYRFQGNYKKALAALQRSQTIKEGLFGKESKEVANCIHKTALIYEDLGDYVKAQPLFELGLRIRKAHSGEDGRICYLPERFGPFSSQAGRRYQRFGSLSARSQNCGEAS